MGDFPGGEAPQLASRNRAATYIHLSSRDIVHKQEVYEIIQQNFLSFLYSQNLNFSFTQVLPLLL